MREAFIAAIGFPKTISEFIEMVAKNNDVDSSDDARCLDVDLILDPPGRRLNWASPVWAKPNDICIFYVVGRMKQYVRSINVDLAENGIPDIYLRPENWDGDPQSILRDFLKYASDVAEKYSGYFIGLGRLDNYPSKLESGGHFSDRRFAHIVDIFPFEAPIPLIKVRDSVFIRRAATITRVDASGWKSLLRAESRNRFPQWVLDAQIGADSLPDEIRGNWRAIIQMEPYRCKTESEFREIIVNPFLEEISDESSLILSECPVVGSNGIVDNAIFIEKSPYMFEIKQNIINDNSVVTQVIRYLKSSHLQTGPSISQNTKIALNIDAPCYVVDTRGIYRVLQHGFDGCSLSTPLLTWEFLARMSRSEIRSKLASYR